MAGPAALLDVCIEFVCFSFSTDCVLCQACFFSCIEMFPNGSG